MLCSLIYLLVLSVTLIYMSGCTYCIINYKDANDSKSFGDSILCIEAYMPYYLDDKIEIELDIKKKNLLIDKVVITAIFPSGDTLHPIFNSYDSSILYGCHNFKSVIKSNDKLIINVNYNYHFNDKTFSNDSTFYLYKDEDCKFTFRMH